MLCLVEKEIPVFDAGIKGEAQSLRQTPDPDDAFIPLPLAFDIHKVGSDAVFGKTFDRRKHGSRQQQKYDR